MDPTNDISFLKSIPNGIDKKVLLQLVEHTGIEAVGILLGVFVEEIEDVVPALKTALESADYTLIDQIAHTTKSTAGSFGATELQIKCSALEQAARAGTHDTILNISTDTIEVINQTTSSYQILITQLGTDKD